MTVVALIALTFSIFGPFLLSMLWAVTLATVSYRAYRWVRARLGGREGLAALVMTLAMLVVVIGPIFLLVVTFVGDAVETYQDLTSGHRDVLMQQVEQNWLVQKVLGLAKEVSGKEIRLKELAEQFARKVPMIAAQAVGDVVGYLFSFLGGLVFVLLSLYYFYKDGPLAAKVLKELLPLPEEDRGALFQELHAALNAAVVGGLLTAFAQGLLGFIILFILGLDKPVLWSCAMAVASLVPLIGTALVWAPMAGIFALRGEVDKALILAGYGTIVIGMADNFLRPLLVGRQIEVHPLLLFFGILGGIAMFGFAGVILGPVCVVFLQVTSRMFRREFKPAEPRPE